MSQFGEVATVFGKVGRADTGTDPAPYSMAETTIRLRPRAEWPKVPRTRWYSGWAPAPLRRRAAACVWPDATPRTTAELIDELDRATRLPGWTQRLDGAGPRAHGHDGDRRAHAGRHPHRLARSGAPGRARHARVRGVRRARARHAQRGVRVAGRRDLAVVRRRSGRARPPRRRPGVGARDRRPARDRRAARRDRATTAGARCACASRPSCPTCGRAAPADQLREITVRARRRPAGAAGQPVPLALLGRPAYVRRPAALRTEHGELVRLRLRRPRATAPTCRATSSAPAARSTPRSRRGKLRLGPGERIEWTGQYELLVGGPAAARAGSSRSSRCRCSACCSCSSAA